MAPSSTFAYSHSSSFTSSSIWLIVESFAFNQNSINNTAAQIPTGWDPEESAHASTKKCKFIRIIACTVIRRWGKRRAFLCLRLTVLYMFLCSFHTKFHMRMHRLCAAAATSHLRWHQIALHIRFVWCDILRLANFVGCFSLHQIRWHIGIDFGRSCLVISYLCLCCLHRFASLYIIIWNSSFITALSFVFVPRIVVNKCMHAHTWGDFLNYVFAVYAHAHQIKYQRSYRCRSNATFLQCPTIHTILRSMMMAALSHSSSFYARVTHIYVTCPQI